MNGLKIWNFENSICVWSFTIFRLNFEALRWRKYCFFYLLQLLHSYFTFLRWIDWDIEQSHTTTLKIPCFDQAPFLDSTLRPSGGENIDLYLLKLLDSYFTFLRWIDWDIELSHTTILKSPCFWSSALFSRSGLYVLKI